MADKEVEDYVRNIKIAKDAMPALTELYTIAVNVSRKVFAGILLFVLEGGAEE